jgi:hypothetical protein
VVGPGGGPAGGSVMGCGVGFRIPIGLTEDPGGTGNTAKSASSFSTGVTVDVATAGFATAVSFVSRLDSPPFAESPCIPALSSGCAGNSGLSNSANGASVISTGCCGVAEIRLPQRERIRIVPSDSTLSPAAIATGRAVQ